MSEEERIFLRIKKLKHAADLPLPDYETVGSSGMDIRAALSDSMVLEPGQRALIPTGLKMAVPKGYEIQVRPRSGLAWRDGITMLNTPGTIDSDYRGEVKLLAVNLGEKPFKIEHGDRIAQIVVCPVMHVAVIESDDLSESSRGDGGFGSTGLK